MATPVEKSITVELPEGYNYTWKGVKFASVARKAKRKGFEVCTVFGEWEYLLDFLAVGLPRILVDWDVQVDGDERVGIKLTIDSPEGTILSLSLPAGLRSKVKAAAAKNGRSMHAEALAIIETGVGK